MPTETSKTSRPNEVDPALPDALYIAEGKDVVDIRAKLTNVGDGLSKAMASDRSVREQETKGYMIVEVVLEKTTHEPRKIKHIDTGALERIEIWKGSAMTFVESSPAIRRAIEEQKKRNETEAEERAGIMRLFEEQRAEEEEAEQAAIEAKATEKPGLKSVKDDD